MEAIGIEGKYLSYKGKPLVRKGQEIFYGDMADKFYLFMMIMGEKAAAGVSVKIPEKVLVQVISTTDGKNIWKQKMVDSLTEAFDLGCAWLDRANAS